MAITLIIENGSGVANANTYVDSAGALAAAYFEAHLHASVWSAATADQQKAAVVQATRAIDTLINWKGRRVAVDQARQWPRTGVMAEGFTIESDTVPNRVVYATLEMAMALLERDRLADTAASQGVSALKLGQGALELELGADPQAALKSIPEQVAALLEPFGTRTRGSGMVPVYRA